MTGVRIERDAAALGRTKPGNRKEAVVEVPIITGQQIGKLLLVVVTKAAMRVWKIRFVELVVGEDYRNGSEDEEPVCPDRFGRCRHV